MTLILVECPEATGSAIRISDDAHLGRSARTGPQAAADRAGSIRTHDAEHDGGAGDGPLAVHYARLKRLSEWPQPRCAGIRQRLLAAAADVRQTDEFGSWRKQTPEVARDGPGRSIQAQHSQ